MADDQHGPAPPTVRIASSRYRIRVVAEPGAPIAFEGDAVIEHAPGETTIGSVRSSLVVTVPEGADVVVGTTNGRVEIRGRVGHAAVVSENGRIEIGEAASVDARSSAGAVRVGSVSGECRIRSSSGRVVVGSCGATDISTRSGRIEVGAADGPAKVHCVSGRIDIGLASANDVDAESVSGRIEVAVPADVRVHRTTLADASVPRPVDTDCTVAARSISGRVAVVSR